MEQADSRVPTYLTVGGMGRAINRSVDTVRELEKRGVITSGRDSANRRIFHPDQVKRALAYYANRA